MDTTYQLTPEEFGVFSDRQFMPLKEKVWEKVEGLLSLLGDKKVQIIKANANLLEFDLSQPFPKISKGENYHSYSYRVLDYPRVLDKDHMFLFRTMVLWGHPIGFHLILSGKFQEAYVNKILPKVHYLPYDVFYAQHESPWIWEEGAMGWFKIGEEEIPNTSYRNFFKLSTFMPLGDYRKIPQKGAEVLEGYLDYLFM